MQDFETFYDVLEVNESASQDEIKPAFIRLAKEYHPDRVPEHLTRLRKDAEERFKRLNEAHGVLGSVTKRAQYDALLQKHRATESQDGTSNDERKRSSAASSTASSSSSVVVTSRNESEQLREQLRALPLGKDHATEFQVLVGRLITLCFAQLTNLRRDVRGHDRSVIRDWIAGNHNSEGFWARIRERYKATQIIFECKNCASLAADDFHQVAYYMNDRIGRFMVLAYRGQEKGHYFDHIRRISEDGSIILLIDQEDLDFFLHHADNSKLVDTHLRELFDYTVGEIS